MKVRALTEDEAYQVKLVRANLLDRAPYYADAALRTVPVAADGLGTWAVDKHWRMYVSPDCLPGGEKGWTVHQCAEVLEHELGHLLREHAARAASIDATNPKLSNLAGDAEINEHLPVDGFVASIGVTPSSLGLVGQRTFEQYYADLNDSSDDDQGPNGTTDGSGNGDSGDGGSDGPDGADADDETTAPNGGTGDTGGNHPEPMCGSGAGNPITGELDPTDTHIAPAVDDATQTVARTATAQAIQRHERTYGQGTIPAGLSRWADHHLQPSTTPWQKVLASVIRRGAAMTAGRQDYTYTRISRRVNATPNVILPGMHAPKPSIAVVLDTSGSMSDQMVTEAIAEVDAIATQLGCTPDRLHTIAVDADAAEPVAYTGIRNLTEKGLTGGGGTDMRVGVARAAELKPTVIVVLTDGYTPWPETPTKNTALIIGIIGANGPNDPILDDTRAAMPWATVLRIGN